MDEAQRADDVDADADADEAAVRSTHPDSSRSPDFTRGRPSDNDAIRSGSIHLRMQPADWQRRTGTCTAAARPGGRGERTASGAAAAGSAMDAAVDGDVVAEGPFASLRQRRTFMHTSARTHDACSVSAVEFGHSFHANAFDMISVSTQTPTTLYQKVSFWHIPSGVL